MGMATVTFPQGLEFSNFFLRYYRPIRGNWWRKTFDINFFQVEPYFSLTSRDIANPLALLLLSFVARKNYCSIDKTVYYLDVLCLGYS